MRNPITTFIDIRKSETLSRLSKDIKKFPLLTCALVLACEEGADRNLIQESTKQAVKMALGKLPEKEAKVLNLSFGIDTRCERTDREVGEMVGLSRERVRQIKVSALKRLRKNGDLDFLRPAA